MLFPYEKTLMMFYGLASKSCFHYYCIHVFIIMTLIISFKCQCCPHIETSQLICCVNQLNQLTVFSMRTTLAFNGLTSLEKKIAIPKLSKTRQNFFLMIIKIKTEQQQLSKKLFFSIFARKLPHR